MPAAGSLPLCGARGRTTPDRSGVLPAQGRVRYSEAVQATMIAGLLGTLAAGSSATAPGPTIHAVLACPAATSDAHRPLLVKADEQVEAGRDGEAARTFVAAFDAMDLGNQVGGTGKFTADRAVSSFLKAWEIEQDRALLEDAERFLVHYLEVLDRGAEQGCSVDRSWGEGRLAEIRGMMPPPGEEPPPDEVEPNPTRPGKECPPAPAIIGVDRVGVALVTVGASLFVAGTGLLITGVALPLDTPQAFTITGSVVMGAGVAVLIPGAVRLGTWRKNKSRARLGVAPWTGRGLAGISVSGRFGAWR